MAVKVNDELNQLYSQPTLSQQEARKLAELTSLLLLVRKNLPSPTKRTKHHTLSATPTTPEVQEDVLE